MQVKVKITEPSSIYLITFTWLLLLILTEACDAVYKWLFLATESTLLAQGQASETSAGKCCFRDSAGNKNKEDGTGNKAGRELWKNRANNNRMLLPYN